MEYETHLASLDLKEERDRQDCLSAMYRYGDNHWWEGADLRAIAYHQLREPILLIRGRLFEQALCALLGRRVLDPDREFSPSNLDALQAEAQAAWEKGSPVWSQTDLEQRYQQIIAGAKRDGRIQG